MAIQRQDNKQTTEPTTLKALQLSGKALPKPKKSTAITQTVDKPKIGRPSEYTDNIGKEIIYNIMSGMSVRELCKIEGMPNRDTIYTWLSKDTDFADHYARACKIRREERFESMDEITDTVEDVQRARLKIDVIKWQLGKEEPKKYGDKLDMTTNGKDLPMPILSLDYTNKED